MLHASEILIYTNCRGQEKSILEINIKISSGQEKKMQKKKMQYALSDSLQGNHCRLPQNRRSLTKDELTNICFTHMHIQSTGIIRQKKQEV